MDSYPVVSPHNHKRNHLLLVRSRFRHVLGGTNNWSGKLVYKKIIKTEALRPANFETRNQPAYEKTWTWRSESYRGSIATQKSNGLGTFNSAGSHDLSLIRMSLSYLLHNNGICSLSLGRTTWRTTTSWVLATWKEGFTDERRRHFHF